MTIRPDSGSFRDPLSRVYVTDDAVWRGISRDGLEDYRALAASRLFAEALADGRLVQTELATDPPTSLREDWAAVLRHERIDPISYPYEWTFSMLRDAALLQLELTRGALAEGLVLKDATAYNIQFKGASPVFIDVGSFERLRPGEPWPGYRQFCELFLNPLLLQSLADVPFHPLLRGSINGISPSLAASVIGPRKRLRRDVLTHVRIHARAERRYADSASREVGEELKAAGFGPKIIEAQLANLERSVQRLEWRASASTWSEYTDRAHYTDADLEAKEAFVARTVSGVAHPLVLDLGANDGRFSKVALGAGARSVVSVDSDHLVVDHLYRDLRQSGERRILPLVLDLADPSPGRGWRGRERPSFVERVRPDVVLCLAVIHHLALTDTVPFEEIVAFLHDFGAPVVVEMPHPDDVMAKRLLDRKRDGLFDHYNQPAWEAALEQRFDVVARETLPSGRRTLYHGLPT